MTRKNKQGVYLQRPSLGKKNIFFISENSLWSVSTRGGIARKLVSGTGRVVSCLLSPDEKHIAYTFSEEGSYDVYIMPSEGGYAKRVTFHNVLSSPAGWSSNSSFLYIRSSMRNALRAGVELFKVSAGGGDLVPLNAGHALWINVDAGGENVLLGKHDIDVAWWKHYRGGNAGTIWIGSLKTMDFKPLFKHPAGYVLPQFDSGRIYFISDRDGTGNLYSTNLEGEDLLQHTRHKKFYVRFLSMKNGKAAYQHAGDIYLCDVKTNQVKRLDIRLSAPLKPEKTYFINTQKYCKLCAVSDDGKNTLFSIRGKQVILPVRHGASRIPGIKQGVRYKLSRFLNDGTSVISVSDESFVKSSDESLEEEELVIYKTDYHKKPVKLGRVPEGYVTDLAVSHDGKKTVAGTNRRQLFLIDIKTKSWELIDTSTYRKEGNLLWVPEWSPDDRYIAYSKVEDSFYSIFLYDVRDREIIRITNSEFDDFFPSFDPSGKYLYFSSMRYIDPYIDFFDINFAYAAPFKPYLLVLHKDTPVPFIIPHEKETEDKKNEKKKDDEKPAVSLYKEGLSNRVFEIPGIPASPFCIASGVQDKILIATWPLKGLREREGWFETDHRDMIKIQVYDLIENKCDTYVEGIQEFVLSANKKWMAVKKDDKYWAFSTGEKPPEALVKGTQNGGAGDTPGLLDFKKIKIQVDLKKEWRQIFLEAWRFQREHFWNENMSGIDWEEVKTRYLPLLDKINTREALSDLLWEVHGELGTSHAYNFGGDFEGTKGYRVGLLGADFQLDEKLKKYRIQKIYRGDSFYKDSFSPLALPGVNVEEGDYLLAINGEKITLFSYPLAHLVNMTGTEVVLTISKNGSAKDSREVTVKTLSSERELRYRDWVNKNIEYVLKKTDGQAGYFHIPDMGTKGLIEFDRYFYQYLDKKGLIIDVRNNGGGYVSQTLLQKLYRQLVGFIKTRWDGRLFTLPDCTFRGSMVVIIDEFAGSDGDIFPQSFKNLHMGTVIGKRTWGGVVGICINTVLVDRGIVTQPEYAIWFTGQGYGVENYGVAPDIEVENDPRSVYEGKDNQLDAAIEELKRLMKEKEYIEPEL